MPPRNNTTGRSTPTPQLRVNTTSNAGAGSSTSTTQTGAATSIPPQSSIGDSTARAVNGLLHAMQQTLSALGMTFDVLGEQTIGVATLGPAVDAVLKIRQVRERVETWRYAQEEAMEKTEADVKMRVTTRIREKLRPQVDQMVADAVAKHVEARVRDELQKQVSQKLKDELEEHRRRILEVKVALANAEAKRHNALIPREAVGQQPLRRLLRPAFATGAPLGTPADGGADGTANGDGDAQKSAKTKKSKKNAGANGSGSGAAAAAPAEAGTPSEAFPRFVSELRTLDAKRARQLAVEYGLATGGAGDVGDDADEEAAKDKEDNRSATPGGAQAKKTGGATGAAQQKTNGDRGGQNAQPKDEKPKEKAEREKKEAAAREARIKEREVRRTEDLNEFMKFIGLGHLVLLPASPVRGADGAMVLQSPLIERPLQAYRPW